MVPVKRARPKQLSNSPPHQLPSNFTTKQAPHHAIVANLANQQANLLASSLKHQVATQLVLAAPARPSLRAGFLERKPSTLMLAAHNDSGDSYTYNKTVKHTATRAGRHAWRCSQQLRLAILLAIGIHPTMEIRLPVARCTS